MNCKYCNAELGENSKFCSNCGKPVNSENPEVLEEAVVMEQIPEEEAAPETEIQETRKNGAGKIAVAVVAVVLVLALLVALIAGGLTGKTQDGDGETVAGTEAEATEGTIPPDGNPDDATCKGTYTVSDEEVIAAADTVVATMGDRELTVGQLQVYYWTEFVYFMQDYGSYASYFGLDVSQPLDTQVCTLVEDTMTWQQYFLACALDTWAGYQSMTLEAEANGLELTGERKTELENLPAQLDASAVQYGLSDGAALMQNNFGAGATVEGYVDFWELFYTGKVYYDDQCEKLKPTAEEVETYYTENEASYTESGVTRDAGKYVDVRHILLMPEGGTTDEETGETTYSEEEWEACRQAAQEVYDLYLAGEMTEDSFAQLAVEHSVDGSASVGGLYENVYEGQMVPNFNDWCFDEARKTGDHDLVRTEYGYHIMYFVDSADIWFATAENDLYAERTTPLVSTAMEKHPAEIDYSAIVLGMVNLG